LDYYAYYRRRRWVRDRPSAGGPSNGAAGIVGEQPLTLYLEYPLLLTAMQIFEARPLSVEPGHLNMRAHAPPDVRTYAPSGCTDRVFTPDLALGKYN
jgi:hypothetical protein